MTDADINGVIFDVNETLFALDGLRPSFEAAGLPPDQLPLWFATVLRDGFALTAAGGWRPFAEVAASALRGLRADLADEQAAAVVAGMRELDPHPDVGLGLRRLRDAGLTVATLTNGSAENTAALLDRAHLSDVAGETLSADVVRRWKPAPDAYLYAARRLSIDPARLLLVAVHPWDCAGAAAAGLRTAWVHRSAQPWPAVFPAPDFSVPDITQLADALLK